MLCKVKYRMILIKNVNCPYTVFNGTFKRTFGRCESKRIFLCDHNVRCFGLFKYRFLFCRQIQCSVFIRGMHSADCSPCAVGSFLIQFVFLIAVRRRGFPVVPFKEEFELVILGRRRSIIRQCFHQLKRISLNHFDFNRTSPESSFCIGVDHLGVESGIVVRPDRSFVICIRSDHLYPYGDVVLLFKCEIIHPAVNSDSLDIRQRTRPFARQYPPVVSSKDLTGIYCGIMRRNSRASVGIIIDNRIGASGNKIAQYNSVERSFPVVLLKSSRFLILSVYYGVFQLIEYDNIVHLAGGRI